MNDRFPREDEWGAALEAFEGTPTGIPEPGDAFRRALLGRTGRRVRARHHRKVLLRTVGAALLFGAGWSLGSSRPPAVVPTVPTVGSPTPGEPTLPADPSELDRALALAEPQVRRVELLRAGDQYLAGESFDPSSALYCYRQVLDESEGETSLEISPEDSWLLKALKVARN